MHTFMWPYTTFHFATEPNRHSSSRCETSAKCVATAARRHPRLYPLASSLRLATLLRAGHHCARRFRASCVPGSILFVLQVALLTAGERLLLTLAKLAVSSLCTAGAAIAMNMQPGAVSGGGASGLWSALDNANGALVLTFIVTFCIADAWMTVYDSAVEAVFLCYLVDQEENDGSLRPYYASSKLQLYMERHKPSYQLPASSPESRSSPEGEGSSAEASWPESPLKVA